MTCGPLMQISPTSLTASSLPSSPTIMTSVDGNGRPIVPVKVALDRVADGDGRRLGQAVTLQRSSQPVFSFHSLATAGCTAMPPPMLTRRCEKSILSKLGVFMSAANIVLTPVNRLNL